jgi:hypothetical protein
MICHCQNLLIVLQDHWIKKIYSKEKIKRYNNKIWLDLYKEGKKNLSKSRINKIFKEKALLLSPKLKIHRIKHRVIFNKITNIFNFKNRLLQFNRNNCLYINNNANHQLFWIMNPFLLLNKINLNNIINKYSRQLNS